MFRYAYARLILINLLFAGLLFGCARQSDPFLVSKLDASAEQPLNKMPVFDVISDPIEPFNRAMWSFNKGMFNWVIYPVNKGYRHVVPSPVRRSIGKAGWNLKYPVHLVNSLLQGKFKDAGAETSRFLLNSTIGVLGFFDVATSVFEIEPHRRDFEQTLAFYGGSQGAYLMLPFMGPSSERNAVGRILDFPFDITSWLFGARAFLSNNNLSFQSDRLSDLINYQADSYVMIRDLWALDRERQVKDYKITPVKGDPEPSIDAIFLAPSDPNFRSLGKTREVRIEATGRNLPYNIWVQPERGPTVVILPGLGGHRLSQSTLALAEMAYRSGYSVITISSTMNWEFMDHAATTPVPGHPAFDSLDVIGALEAIRADLLEEYPDHSTHAALMGYSLGGIQALHIAAREARGQTDGKLFDRYLAINPPADILYAMSQLDSYFDAPMRWQAENRVANVENTLLKAVTLGQGELSPTGEIPLTRIESEFLIGLSFQMALRDVIYVSQSRVDLGILNTPAAGRRRQPRYDEIREFNYREYMESFVLPCYIDSRANTYTRQELIEMGNLESLTPSLRGNDKIWVHTNANDFLIRPQDIDWFKSTFADHFILFGSGGHLGNLYQSDVQERIMRSLDGMR
jgi:ABC-type transporter lipoprotein component MlaA/pimeloyl-ACP methyl ester carboxylesterase